MKLAPRFATWLMKLASRLATWFWYVLAAVLLAATLGYIAVHTVVGISGWFVLGVLGFLVAVAVLFLGEGCEVAVAMLIDKDPQQFDEFEQQVRASFATLWQSRRRDPPPFIIGRQLLVVFAVVVLTLLSGKLTEISPLDAIRFGSFGLARDWLATVATWLQTPFVADSFGLLFPTFLALWIAQLPSKFMAHEDPVRTYSWIAGY